MHNKTKEKPLRISQSGPDVLPGLPMTLGLQHLIESEILLNHAQVPDPYHAGQLAQFFQWVQEVPPKSRSGLPRYLQAFYDEHEELTEMFPEVNAGELIGFRWWLKRFGRASSPWIQIFGHDFSIRRHVNPTGRLNHGVDVVGFFNAEHGIGEAARLLVEALRAVDTPISTLAYRNSLSRQNFHFETDEVGLYRTVIRAINAELNEPLNRTFGENFFRDTYAIGQWFWELEVAPTWYKRSYQHVDELWAPTRFIEQMLQREAPKRVHVEYMPLPLRRPTFIENVDRQVLGLDDRFMFLFTFDFMSVMKRKNPIGLVEAFKKAFTPDEGPILVLKSINGETRPDGFAKLVKACEGRDDIIVMNQYLDSEMSSALMNCCDCYVSLHRSEGLGLTIAEAILLGKPVIATSYSGNLDFMSPETSFMVPWKRIKVGSDAEAYSPKATWAEPDIDVAAEMMRIVYKNPDVARIMAERGRRDLETRFSPELTGRQMRRRLETIWGNLDAI